MRQRWTRDDQGVTLVELLVVMILTGVLAGIVITTVIWAQRTTTTQTRNGQLWADIQDASTQLMRDVNDAQTIITAEANHLMVQVIRDDKCQDRDWVADTTQQRLTVTTRFYEQLQCTGPFTERVDRIIGDNAVGTNTSGTNPALYTATATFNYHDTLSDAALPFPVEPDRVTRVTWNLAAKAGDGYRVETLTSGAAFTGRGQQATGGGNQENATAPLLCLSLRTPVDSSCGTVPAVAAGKVEGVDRPVLQWVDTSPTLTMGWTIWRIANPDGMASNDPARTTWTQVLYSASPNLTSWSDASLPPGYSAQYVVRATTADGVGPTSNQVVTGLRPSAPTLTAAGASASIGVSWTQTTGATGYDLFRDGSLIASLGATTSFTDQSGAPGWTGSGYGHSHYYRVVPTNRWENRLTTGSDGGRLPIGADVTTPYTGGTRLASAQTATSGDFTAPAAPAVTTAASSGRENIISWTPAGWVGSGPTTGRVTSWQVWYRSSTETGAVLTEPAAATTSFTHAGRPAGRWGEYTVVGANESGAMPSSVPVWARQWQRPPTPSCFQAGATTRSLTIGHNGLPATEDETFGSYQTRLDSGGWVTSGSVFDPLRDNTTYSFRVHAVGTTSGLWSDEGSCTGKTTLLATPAVPTCTATPDSPTAPTTVRFSSNGSLSRSTAAAPDAGYYDATATATISDGYNSNSRTSSCGANVAAPPQPGAIPPGSPCTTGAQWAMGPAGSGGPFAGIANLRTCFYAAPNATSYTAKWTWADKNGIGWVGGTKSVDAGVWNNITACFFKDDTTASGPTVTVTPHNAYGDGTPRMFVGSIGAPAQTCV